MGRSERPPRPSNLFTACMGGLVLLSFACSRAETAEPVARPRLDRGRAQQTVAAYAEIAHAVYLDALKGVRVLDGKVNDFVRAPSVESLRGAREAWLAARVPYVQSEVFRFYDGPIDRVEPLINAWPIDENFVDTSEASLPPGIVGDREHYPEIDEGLLIRLNESVSETSISSGFHVIEFLLWGQDKRSDGPGERPHTDFVVGEGHGIEARRAAYLRVSSALLVRHIEEVVQAWDTSGHTRTGEKNFRALLSEMPAEKALGLMLKGMGSLSGPELAGERLTVAYETKDQENEHSCFSDSTHLDMVGDALGVENVCLGRYRRANGSELKGQGVCALVESVDSVLGKLLEQQITASVAAARTIPAPFDQAILGTDTAPGRAAVKQTIRSLESQATAIARSAAVLGADLGLATARAGTP